LSYGNKGSGVGMKAALRYDEFLQLTNNIQMSLVSHDAFLSASKPED